MNDTAGKSGSDRAPQSRALLFRLILANPSIAIAIVVSAMMLVGLTVWAFETNTFATDFSVYWRTANEAPSTAYLPRAELPFPYAPTMMLWIAPLSVIGLWPAYFVFVIVSAVALVMACRRHMTSAETVLVLVSPPVVNALITGQVSVALAGLMLWAVTTDRHATAGVVFAAIASIKPQVVLLAPLMLLLNRDWRAIASSALTFIVLITSSVAVFGWERWPEWIGSMSNFRRVLHNQNVLGVAATPASAAENYGLAPLPFLLLGIMCGVWLIFRCRNSAPLAKCAAIATASLLSAPYAITYDLAPVIPFLVFATFRGSVGSAIALSGALHPIPLMLAVFSLNRTPK